MKTDLLKLFFLIIVINIIPQYNVKAQNSVEYFNDYGYDSLFIKKISLEDTTGCYNFKNYIPTQSVQIKTIRINIHILQENDGTGEFLNILEHINYFKDLISRVNYIYENIERPTIPVNPLTRFISDSYIRFKLDSIYFWQDSIGYHRIRHEDYYNYLNYSINLDKQINIFYFKCLICPKVGQGWANQIPGNFVNVMNLKYTTNIDTIIYHSKLVAHELGHILGLSHTFRDCLDDTFFPDYPTFSEPCDSVSISNNLMGYNSCRNYLSPQQLGIMHLLLSSNVFYSSDTLYCKYLNNNINSIKYLTFCEYDENNSLSITGKEEWNIAKVIGGDLILEPGSELTINCELSMPDNSSIIINENSKLILNGIITNSCFRIDSLNAIIRVEESGSFVLNSGAQLFLGGDGKIIVEGKNNIRGKMIFNKDAKIFLANEQTKIESNGGLIEICTDADFSYAGKGFLSIKNSIFKMGERSRLSINGPMEFDNVKLTSATGVRNTHRGLRIYGQAGVEIKNSIFEKGECGLDAMQLYGGNPLTLDNCEFNDCKYGLKTTGAGARLSDLTINACDYGWFNTGNWFDMSFDNGTVTNCSKYGIFNYAPQQKTELTITGSTFESNNIGIGQEQGVLTLKCNHIEENTTGVYAKNNTILNLSNDGGGGYNDIINNNNTVYFNNPANIKLGSAKRLDMNNGFNNLYLTRQGMTESLTKTITGSLQYATCFSSSNPVIIANNNKWYSNNENCPNTLKYNITGSIAGTCIKPVEIQCNNVMNSTYECPGSGTDIFSTFYLCRCDTCPYINTPSFNNTRYNEAVRTAIMMLEATDSTRDEAGALGLFSEILSTPIDSSNSEMLYLADLAYSKMNSALARALERGKLSGTDSAGELNPAVIKVLNIHNRLRNLHSQYLVNTRTIKSDNYTEQFSLELNKAQVYRLAGRRDLALQQLDSIGNCFLTGEEIEQLDDWRKLINAENLILTGQVAKEKFDSLYSIDYNKINTYNIAYTDTSSTVDSTATIGENSHIGANNVIGGNAWIGKNVRTGNNCIVGEGVSIADNSVIYDNVTLGYGTVIGEGAIIKDNIITGSNVIIENHSYIGDSTQISGKTTIGSYTRIGSGVNIDSLVYIGDGTYIGNKTIVNSYARTGANLIIKDSAELGINSYFGDRVIIGKKVIVKDSTIIYQDAKVNEDITIGKNSVICTGELIIGDIGDNYHRLCGDTLEMASPLQNVYNKDFALYNAKIYNNNFLNGFNAVSLSKDTITDDFLTDLNKYQKQIFEAGEDVNFSPSNLSQTYLWDFGDCATSTEKLPKHKYNKAGRYTVTLQQGLNNCSNLTITYTGAVIIYPATGTTYSAEDTLYCSTSRKVILGKENTLPDLTIPGCYSDTNGYVSFQQFDTSGFRMKYRWKIYKISPDSLISIDSLERSEYFDMQELVQSLDTNISYSFSGYGSYIIKLSSFLMIKDMITGEWLNTGSYNNYNDTIIIYQPLMITGQPSGNTLCGGATAVFNVVVSGTGAINYQWYKDYGQLSINSAELAIEGVSEDDAGNYYCVISNACGSVTSDTVSLFVRTLPVITKHPASDTICEGSEVSFSVSASGEQPLSFQWYKIVDGQQSIVNGAVDSTLNIQNLTLTDTGSYYCVVSNNCSSATSDTVSLTIHTPPVIETPEFETATMKLSGQLVSQYATDEAEVGFRTCAKGTFDSDYDAYKMFNQSQNLPNIYTYNDEGEALAINSQPPLNYGETFVRLGFNVKDSGDFVIKAKDIEGFNIYTQIYLIDSLTNQLINLRTTTEYNFAMDTATGNDRFWLRFTAYDSTGNRVNEQPCAGSVNCPGSGVSYRVRATGTEPLSYQWYKNDTIIDEATYSTFNIQNSTLADTGSYYCIISNSCGVDTSRVYNYEITAPVEIITQPESVALCEGIEANFSVSVAGTGPISYQWFKDDTLIAGARDSTYKIQNTTLADIGSYYCIISNDCASTTSDRVFLIINYAPVIIQQPISDSLCIGSYKLFNIGVTGAEPVFFQWKKNNSIIIEATNNSFIIDEINLLDRGNYTCEVTNKCGTIISDMAYLVVYHPPKIISQPKVK